MPAVDNKTGHSGTAAGTTVGVRTGMACESLIACSSSMMMAGFWTLGI